MRGTAEKRETYDVGWEEQGQSEGESLEKRKSNKLNWFVRSYLCSLRRRLSGIITTTTHPHGSPPLGPGHHPSTARQPEAGTTRALRCVLRF